MRTHSLHGSSIRLTTSALAAGVLLASGLTACGDDSADALPRSEFVERANELCADADRRGSEAFESVSFSDPAQPSDEELQELASELLPTLQDHRQDFAELGPPEDGKEEFEQLLNAQERTIERVKAGSQDPSAASELADPEFFADISSAEEALGICPQEEE